ncbi:Sulfoxide reductase heme-binding subunit YedZ [uncultured archaeon]|nr:Sulfoxide reductase heme-binding subunit YedZ [uncultured archaeon]
MPEPEKQASAGQQNPAQQKAPFAAAGKSFLPETESTFWPWLFVAVFSLSILVFYVPYNHETKQLDAQKLVSVLLFRDLAFSLEELDRALGVAGLGLMAIALSIGPLSRLFPKVFGLYLHWRKPISLSALAAIIVHGTYMFATRYAPNLAESLSSLNDYALLLTGIAATIIFGLVVAVSRKEGVQVLGYRKWKLVQNTAYAGLALVVAHFVIIKTENGYFDVTPFALAAFAVAVFAVAQRALILLAAVPETEKSEHHFGEPGNN